MRSFPIRRVTRRLAPASGRFLVAALALGGAASASHAQNTYPEVELSWKRPHFTGREGFSQHLRVQTDRVPGRVVWFRVEAIHHGGATKNDYRVIERWGVGPDRRESGLLWKSLSDDLDDDCESVELRLVAEKPRVIPGEQTGVTVSGQPTRVRIIDDDGAFVDCGWGDVGGAGTSPEGNVGGGPPPPEPAPEPEPEPPPPPPVPPEAAFTVDVPCADGLCRARTGEDVTFTDTSSGTVSRRSWDFYVAAGRAPSAATARYAWSSPGFYEVTLTVSGADHESTASRVFLVEAANPAGTCQADGETICLQDSRYQVRATWRSPEGEALPARVARAGTNDSGLFWFHDAENWEVLVKVLDGCALNGADWVFVASATTLGFDVEVADTVTGEVRRYAMSAGSPAPALTDAAAFPERCRTQVR